MQDPIVSRIHRIKGQIEAVERMYGSKKANCVDLITQIQAARAALARVASLLLTDEAERCVDEGDIEEFEKILNKTFKTI